MLRVAAARVAAPVRASPAPAAAGQVRGLSIKDLRLRIKAVSNIAKITKTMKMISQSKLRGVSMSLNAARPFSVGIAQVFEAPKAEASDDTKAPAAAAPAPPAEGEDAGEKEFLQGVVLASSDRGLAGAIHGNVHRMARGKFNEFKQAGVKFEVAPLGDKARAALKRLYGEHFVLSCSDLGRKRSVTFPEVSLLTAQLLDRQWSQSMIVYNKFVNAVTFSTSVMELPALNDVLSREDYNAKYEQYEFEGDKEEVLGDMYQFYHTSAIYGALLENAASEVSSRMQAMENATRNAEDMISSLSMKYNRARQASITTELIEIISGAAALDD